MTVADDRVPLTKIPDTACLSTRRRLRPPAGARDHYTPSPSTPLWRGGPLVRQSDTLLSSSEAKPCQAQLAPNNIHSAAPTYPKSVENAASPPREPMTSVGGPQAGAARARRVATAMSIEPKPRTQSPTRKVRYAGAVMTQSLSTWSQYKPTSPTRIRASPTRAT